MDVTTQREIETGGPYWAGRWGLYLSRVVDYLAALDCDGCDVLEVGPYTRPLVPGSMRMDIAPVCSRCLLHDAGDTPWPFAETAFRVVVACQVWEHLAGRQAQAFAEARRVADLFVMTVPWYWVDGEEAHRDIGVDTVRQWSGGETVTVFDTFGGRALFVWGRLP
ncbi:MAG: hypothetical protein U9Q07_12080 [Planctomycetota bacterium]|nr:hypothetical protein [Planctomycetota bacterium]